MKRLLLVTQNFYPEIGSAANRMKNLYVHFESKGYKVHVLTTEPSYPNENMYMDKSYYNNAELNAVPDYKVIRLQMSHKKHKNSMSSRLMYYMEFMMKVHYFVKHAHQKFDYLYVTSPNIFVPWGALFFQGKLKPEKLLEVRDLWPDSVVAIDRINIDFFMPVLKRLEKKMYMSADKIVINNVSFKRHIESMNVFKPMLYIPNGVNPGEFEIERKFDTFTVVYTGNIGYAQDVTMLKNIAQLFEQEKIHFNAVIYGVNSKQFKDFITSENLKYVKAIPLMSKQQCLSFTSKHHVALSILKENEVLLNVLPGKVVDAICTGLPIITNLAGDTNTLINQNGVGYAKAFATAQDIVNAVKNYRDDHMLLAQHSANALKLAHAQFNWHENINKIIEFME